MSYNITKDIPGESTGPRFIDVGIHENVEITEIRYDKTDKGNEFLAFTFLTEDGQTLSHTEWKPVDDDPEKFEQKQRNQAKRVKHIAKRFIDEEQFVFVANDFKEFATKTISLIGDKFKGVKLRIKVVYSWNNYTTLPNYLPFIENMTVPKADSLLKITSIDKLTRDAADRDTTGKNPFEKDENPTEEKDDRLPF
jgi:hypothetical protein